MRLRDPRLLKAYMMLAGINQARLGRRAGCSRQFIHMLLTGEKRSCRSDVADRIEEAVRVRSGTLFVPTDQPVERNVTHVRPTRARPTV